MNIVFRFTVSGGKDLYDIWRRAEGHVRRLCDMEDVNNAAWVREWAQWSVDIEIDAVRTQGGDIVAYEADIDARRRS